MNDDIKHEIVMALTENILSGQLDSEDGNTEKQIEDILKRYGLKKEP